MTRHAAPKLVEGVIQPEWIISDKGLSFECKRCGATERMTFGPRRAIDWTKGLLAFIAKHRGCP